MEIKYEIITPEIAKGYLDKNTENYRKLMPSKVDLYANDMKNGLWQNNGEPIQFSKSGTLLNGQHRLSAIVKSGVSVPMFVVYDVDDGVTIYDAGTNRTTPQILQASGVCPGARNMTVCGAIVIFLSGRFGGGGSVSARRSKADVVRYIVEHEREIEDAWKSSCASAHDLLKKSPVVCAAYTLLILGNDFDTVRKFFSVVGSGYATDDDDCSSCISLRNLLIEHRGRNAVSPLDRETEFNCTVKAFDDFKKNVHRKIMYKDRDARNIGMFAFGKARLLRGLADTEKTT